jgi:hypothetical protein
VITPVQYAEYHIHVRDRKVSQYKFEDACAAHRASYSVEIGGSLTGGRHRDMKMTTHIHLILKRIMYEYILYFHSPLRIQDEVLDKKA